MSELSCPPKQARAEGAHGRHSQSQHVHPHRPTNPAANSCCVEACGVGGLQRARTLAGTAHSWPQDPSPAGPSGDRFSGCEVFFQPACGRFKAEAVLAWGSGCGCRKRVLSPWAGGCWPEAKWEAEATPAAVLWVAGCWPALQSQPCWLCNGAPGPPSLPTVGAAWAQPSSSEQLRFDSSGAAEMPPLGSASSFLQSKQHFVLLTQIGGA